MAGKNRASINEVDKQEQDTEVKTGMKAYLQQDDHFICCNVEKSNFPCIGVFGLIVIRIALLSVMLFVAFWALKIDFKLGFFF